MHGWSPSTRSGGGSNSGNSSCSCSWLRLLAMVYSDVAVEGIRPEWAGGWFFVLLLRRVAVAASALLLPINSAFMSFGLLAPVFLVSLLGHAAVQPYASAEDNALEGLSLFSLSMQAIGGLLYASVGLSSSTRHDNRLEGQVGGTDASSIRTLGQVVVAISMLGTLLLTAGWLLWNSVLDCTFACVHRPHRGGRVRGMVACAGITDGLVRRVTCCCPGTAASVCGAGVDCCCASCCGQQASREGFSDRVDLWQAWREEAVRWEAS